MTEILKPELKRTDTISDPLTCLNRDKFNIGLFSNNKLTVTIDKLDELLDKNQLQINPIRITHKKNEKISRIKIEFLVDDNNFKHYKGLEIKTDNILTNTFKPKSEFDPTLTLTENQSDYQNKVINTLFKLEKLFRTKIDIKNNFNKSFQIENGYCSLTPEYNSLKGCDGNEEKIYLLKESVKTYNLFDDLPNYVSKRVTCKFPKTKNKDIALFGDINKPVIMFMDNNNIKHFDTPTNFDNINERLPAGTKFLASFLIDELTVYRDNFYLPLYIQNIITL